MNDTQQTSMNEISVDETQLYREELYTDLKVATIRQLTPVRSDGSEDPGRAPIFSAQTHLMTRAGPLPLEAPIAAATLAEACTLFPQAVREGMEELAREMEKRQREEASRIVVPGQDFGGPQPAGQRGPVIG